MITYLNSLQTPDLDELEFFWAISDMHFNHANVIKYSQRPFRDIYHMNQTIIDNWNSVVKPEHTVFCMGDVAFAPHEVIHNLIQALNGKKYLILGNHDIEKTVTAWKRCGFIDAFKQPIVVNKYILSHYPLEDAVEGYTNLHGHVHGDISYISYNPKFHRNVSVENINYTPLKVRMK